MASVALLVFSLLVVSNCVGADYCNVKDAYLKREVRIKLCGSSESKPNQCKSTSGQIEAFTDFSDSAKCVKCKVPGKSCTKHEDCCSGTPRGLSFVNRGTCLAQRCTVCAHTNRPCHDSAPLCCQTETNNDIQCRAVARFKGGKEYRCMDDRCKVGGSDNKATCLVDGYAGMLSLCDCPTEEFKSMECRDKSCRSCKRYLGPCSTKVECCDGADCVEKKCKPKCLPHKALCKGVSIPCCEGLSCKKDNYGDVQCH